MSYHPAFHLVDGVFVRCRICAAVVYTEDTATHDAFHEQIDFLEAERKGMEVHLSRLDERDEQLRQMYEFLSNQAITPEMRERLTEPDDPIGRLRLSPGPGSLGEARQWRRENFPGISDE